MTIRARATAALAAGLTISAATLTREAEAQTTAATPQPLDEIEVRAAPAGPGGVPVTATTAGPVRGYQALTSSATKTGSPIQETPQSVQVITRELIEDQKVNTVTEALRNVSGVQPQSTLNFGQNTSRVRGFTSERFLDGLPIYYQPGGRDLSAGIERIEVLKGPAGILYAGGAAPIGGIINTVSKLPVFAVFSEAGITVGSRGYVSPYFDFNRPLNVDGTVLLRVTGQFQRDVPSVAFVETRSLALNPTLTFTNNLDTSLTLQGVYSRRASPEYSGLPAVGTVSPASFRIRPYIFPSSRTLPDTTSELYAATARLDHRFDGVWSTFTTVRYSRSSFDEPDQFVFGNSPFVPPASFAVFNGLLRENVSEVTVNPNLQATFDWGPTRNTLLLSGDYDRVRDRAFTAFTPAGLVDFRNPVFPAFREPADRSSATANTYVNAGLSFQVQSSLWERVHLLAGVREAYVDLNGLTRESGSRTKLDRTKALPRAGVVIDVFKDAPGNVASIFADYSEGIRVIPFFNSTPNPRPETSQQVEGGIKLSLASGVSGTVSAFEITRQNVVTADPSRPFSSVQTGEQRSRGIELDLVWQPDPHWQILASYAHVDARVTKDNAQPIAARLQYVAPDSGRFWANYRFGGALQGLSIGAGVYAASRTPITTDNRFVAPGIVTVDANIAYEIRDWTLSLAGKNLTDRVNYQPYQFLGGLVRPSDRRSVYATAAVKF